jgi:hypothetical protein
MLAKLKHHECLEDEAKEASSQKKSIALKASHGRNKKKDVHDPSSNEEQEEDSDEEEALLTRNYRKYLKKKEMKRNGGKPYKKRFCYGCGEIGHFIADCPKEKKKHKHNKDDGKKYKSKKRGEAHLGEEWESNDESDDSSDKDKEKKGAAMIAIQETSFSSPKLFTDHTSSPSLFTDLSSSPRLFTNLTDNDYYTPTCLMGKREKVPHNSPTHSSNECSSCDENDDELANNMIKKFGKSADS